MKTLLVTTLGAFVITLVFVVGGYTLYRIEVNFTVSVVVLGIAWMVSLWFLYSTVFSKKKKGIISWRKH